MDRSAEARPHERGPPSSRQSASAMSAKSRLMTPRCTADSPGEQEAKAVMTPATLASRTAAASSALRPAPRGPTTVT